MYCLSCYREASCPAHLNACALALADMPLSSLRCAANSMSNTLHGDCTNLQLIDKPMSLHQPTPLSPALPLLFTATGPRGQEARGLG